MTRREYQREWFRKNKERLREKTRARAKRYRDSHSDQIKAATKAWRDANKNKIKHYTLSYLYGITSERWDALFAAQGRRCAICLTEHPDGRGWSTDHNHATGKVRGILCARCNAGIGMLGDDPTTMQRAARYVASGGDGSPAATRMEEAS